MNHDVSDVGGPHAETWWHARNTRLRELPWTDSSSLLPDHVCGLLDEVEAAFAMTGARTPAWEGRPVDQSPAEEEYSRCLDPGKFRIIQSRIDAWAKVLVDRGWAHLETDPSNERRGSHEHSQTTLVLRPTAEAHTGGAVPLSYLVYYSTDLEATLNVEVCAGEPPYVLAELPGCGCDACRWVSRRGSRRDVAGPDLVRGPRIQWGIERRLEVGRSVHRRPVGDGLESAPHPRSR